MCYLIQLRTPALKACLLSRFPPPPILAHKMEENTSAFQIDREYHDRLNLCHVFFILFFSSAD